jgi:hypothetical protein
MSHERENYVTVFASGNEALLVVAKSLLESAEIDYLVRGEAIQAIWPGVAGSGFSAVGGPVELLVKAEDETEARKLLASVEESDTR